MTLAVMKTVAKSTEETAMACSPVSSLRWHEKSFTCTIDFNLTTIKQTHLDVNESQTPISVV